MKIIQLTAENVKKLSAVEITPDGNIVQITGKNAQGKTSVLDAIWWAIAGTENIQKQPIRAGADKARVELKLGSEKTVELIVERRFTEKASYLEVKTADGAKYPSPQKMLDDLLGALTFDPLDFMRRDGKGQFDILKGLVPLGIDLDAFAAIDKEDREKRTRINRDAKAKRAQADAIEGAFEGLPAASIDESKLLDSLQTAADTNADVERRHSNRRNAETNNIAARAGASKLRADAANLLAEAARLEAQADETERRMQEAGPLPEPVDLTALRADLDAARGTNALIADRDRQAAIAAEAADLEAQAKLLTDAIEKRAAERMDAIAKARMPIDGLGFDDLSVTYRGLPLDQASDAEQLMISTAIAAALNPKLRVLRIRDGSLLDDDAMERLATFATEHDFQIWIERVDVSGTVGIVMEDGHVKGQHGQAA